MIISLAHAMKSAFSTVGTIFETESAREKRWIKEGQAGGATHVIVVLHKINEASAPVPRFVQATEDAESVAKLIEGPAAHTVGGIIRIPPL